VVLLEFLPVHGMASQSLVSVDEFHQIFVE
jgi:hypothetical protein